MSKLKNNKGMALFFVFRGNDYLGWDCFDKELVTIGSSDGADLVLKGDGVADIHVNCLFKDGEIIASGATSEGVLVKYRQVGSCTLGLLDFIDIGPYTLKVKVKQASENWDRSVLLKQSQLSDFVENHIMENPKLPVSIKTIVEMNCEPPEEAVEPDSLDVCEESIDIDTSIGDLQGEVEHFTVGVLEDLKIKKEICESVPLFLGEEDDEDSEEFEEEVPFNLTEKLIPGKLKDEESSAVEILTTRGEHVLNVDYLRGNGSSYFVDGQEYPIAVKDDELYCYFTKTSRGTVYEDGNEFEVLSLCNEDNLFDKEKDVYRFVIPDGGEVLISSGDLVYSLRSVNEIQIPFVSEVAEEPVYLFENIIKSTFVHAMLIFLVWQFASFNPPDRKIRTEESRFVKVDATRLEALKKNVKKTKKVIKKKVVVMKKPVMKSEKKGLAKGKKKIKSVKKQVGSLLNKKGKGSKQGKVKKRNLGQEGMFSALALIDSISFQPDEALAAVTNLDVVTSSADSIEGQFKVGGIVSNVDTREILMADAGIVATRGSTQVLGSEGENELATLSSGNTGNGKVRALVVANLDKMVKINGGMSREVVRKVIDQHLDEISYCYETALLSNPSLMGKVVSEWIIQETGKVSEVKVEFSSVNSGEIHSCINRSIKSWTFPKPKGNEVVVSYPFIFDVLEF